MLAPMSSSVLPGRMLLERQAEDWLSGCIRLERVQAATMQRSSAEKLPYSLTSSYPLTALNRTSCLK
jgi:hypothetical protein